MPSLKTYLFRKKRAPLACSMSLDTAHSHSDACFVDIRPLSIVELFQPQSCASCPPAIPLIHAQVTPDPNALVLTYDVTHWDTRSGWADTFGNPASGIRPKAYVTRWARNGVFTPRVVVDGIADGVGRPEGEDEYIRDAPLQWWWNSSSARISKCLPAALKGEGR